MRALIIFDCKGVRLTQSFSIFVPAVALLLRALMIFDCDGARLMQSLLNFDLADLLIICGV